MRSSRGARPARLDVTRSSVAGQQHGLVVLDDRAPWSVRPSCGTTPSPPPTRAWFAQAAHRPTRGLAACGSVPLAAFTIAKLSWLHRSEPDGWARLRTCCLPHDWLTLEALGRVRHRSRRRVRYRVLLPGGRSVPRWTCSPIVDGDATGRRGCPGCSAGARPTSRRRSATRRWSRREPATTWPPRSASALAPGDIAMLDRHLRHRVRGERHADVRRDRRGRVGSPTRPDASCRSCARSTPRRSPTRSRGSSASTTIASTRSPSRRRTRRRRRRRTPVSCRTSTASARRIVPTPPVASSGLRSDVTREQVGVAPAFHGVVCGLLDGLGCARNGRACRRAVACWCSAVAPGRPRTRTSSPISRAGPSSCPTRLSTSPSGACVQAAATLLERVTAGGRGGPGGWERARSWNREPSIGTRSGRATPKRPTGSVEACLVTSLVTRRRQCRSPIRSSIWSGTRRSSGCRG